MFGLGGGKAAKSVKPLSVWPHPLENDSGSQSKNENGGERGEYRKK